MKYHAKSESLFHQQTLRYQKELINVILDSHGGNVFRAAKHLGISRNTLYKIIGGTGHVYTNATPRGSIGRIAGATKSTTC